MSRDDDSAQQHGVSHDFVANELVMQWAVLGLGAPYDGMVLADVQSRFG